MLPGNSLYPDDLCSLGAYYTASLFSPIAQFCELHVLYSSSVVLNPSILQLLGNLPHLKSLTAYSVSNQRVEEEQILIASLTLPDHSFPALQNLKIDCISETVISKLWQTPPLVQKLMAVRVKPTFEPSYEVWNDLICAVCHGSPEITDIELDLVQTEYVELSSAVMGRFRRLPLRHLQIWDGYTDDCQSLALALPSVEFLEMETMLLSFRDLTLVTKYMPNLQYLSARLALWGWPSAMNLPHNSSSPSPCHIDSSFTFEDELHITFSNADKAVGDIAQYVIFCLSVIVVFILLTFQRLALFVAKRCVLCSLGL